MTNISLTNPQHYIPTPVSTCTHVWVLVWCAALWLSSHLLVCDVTCTRVLITRTSWDVTATGSTIGITRRCKVYWLSLFVWFWVWCGGFTWACIFLYVSVVLSRGWIFSVVLFPTIVSLSLSLSPSLGLVVCVQFVGSGCVYIWLVATTASVMFKQSKCIHS